MSHVGVRGIGSIGERVPNGILESLSNLRSRYPVTKPKRIVAQKLLLTIAALALFATACGGGGPTSEESNAAIASAEANVGALQLTSDVASTQLLDTADGEITQLADVVTGDRPVLLWYWAPH